MDALDRLAMLASQQQQQQQHELVGDSESSSRLSSAEWPQLGSTTPPPLQQQSEWTAEEAEDADFDDSKRDCEPLASAAEIEAAGIEEIWDGGGDDCSHSDGGGDGDWWRCVPRVEGFLWVVSP